MREVQIPAQTYTTMKPIKFTPPKNQEEAKKRSDELLLAILRIENQLGNHDDRPNYGDWRKRTLYALVQIKMERNRLKAYLEKMG